METVPAVQRYAWGAREASALTKRVAGEGTEEECVAELWYGCHPSAPAKVKVSEEGADPAPLAEHLGMKDTPMGYLVKVLSARQPLSLQLHPDEETAKKLHEEQPDVYKDPHAKPEMAIAMSEKMQLMCGFRKTSEITTFFSTFKSLQDLLPQAAANKKPIPDDQFLRELMKKLYALSPEEATVLVHALKEEIHELKAARTERERSKNEPPQEDASAAAAQPATPQPRETIGQDSPTPAEVEEQSNIEAVDVVAKDTEPVEGMGAAAEGSASAGPNDKEDAAGHSKATDEGETREEATDEQAGGEANTTVERMSSTLKVAEGPQEAEVTPTAGSSSISFLKSFKQLVRKTSALGSAKAPSAALWTALGVVERLLEIYPNDRGVIAPLILNYMEIEAGQAVEIGPNIIHAYINGDCLEIMKMSDNVIRAGLTPKFQDVDRLLNLCSYKSLSPERHIMVKPKTLIPERLQCFIPTITKDFRVYSLNVPRANRTETIDIPLPLWGPLQIFCFTSAQIADSDRLVISEPCADATTGEALPPAWKSVALRFGACYTVAVWGSVTVEVTGVADLSAAAGEDWSARLMFVIPNLEPERLKARKEESTALFSTRVVEKGQEVAASLWTGLTSAMGKKKSAAAAGGDKKLAPPPESEAGKHKKGRKASVSVLEWVETKATATPRSNNATASAAAGEANAADLTYIDPLDLVDSD